VGHTSLYKGKKSMFFVPKVFFIFQNWTKKMSKNEKPRNTFEKTVDLLHILKLGSGRKKNNSQFVTTFFLYFLRKMI
jgi:hypothetical protein